MRKKLGVLHEFQLFKYARHFTVLAGREGQEKSVVPKGKNEIKDSLGQLWPYSFQIGLLRVNTFIKLPPKPSII